MTVQLDNKILRIRSSKDLLKLIVDIQIEAIESLTEEDFFKIYPHLVGSLDKKSLRIHDYKVRTLNRLREFKQLIPSYDLVEELPRYCITSRLGISTRWYNTLKHILFHLEPSILLLLRKDGPTYVREVWEFFFREDESRQETVFFTIKSLKP